MQTANWKPKGAPQDEYFFDPEIPSLYQNFIEKLCRIPDGFTPGAPLKLIEWQVEFLEKVFGTMRWSEEFNCHVRQHNEAFVGIAKKNGKTGFVAALAIAQCALGSKQEKQNIIVVAADIDQAKIMFEAAADMIRMNPRLDEAFVIRPGYNLIRHKKSRGTIRVKAPDAQRLYGQKPTMVIIDELVAQKNDSVYKTLKSAQVSKKDMLLISITTAGYINESPFCYDMWLECQRIERDPLVNPRRFVWLRETALDVDPGDRKAWAHANPGFGITKSREAMEALYNEAVMKPSAMAEFKAMQLNQWVDGSSSWIERHIWEQSGGDANLFDEALLHGRTCYMGMDLSKGVDFSSVALVFPGSPTDEHAEGWTVLLRSWVSEDSVNARKDYMKRKINDWSERWVTICPGSDIKKKADVLPQVVQDCKDFNVKMVGVDPYLFDVLEEELEDLGIGPLVKVTQNYTTLSEPTKELEHSIVNKRVWHGHNPVLGWQIGNVVLDRGTQGDIKINKKAKREAIDGVAAMINALHVAAAKEETPAWTGFIPMGRHR